MKNYTKYIKAIFAGIVAMLVVDVTILYDSDVFTSLTAFVVYFALGYGIKKKIPYEPLLFHICVFGGVLFLSIIAINEKNFLLTLSPGILIISFIAYMLGYFSKWNNAIYRVALFFALSVLSIYCFYIIPQYHYQRHIISVKPSSAIKYISVIDDNGELKTLNIANKIVLLDFWFINCGQCIQKMPYMQQLQDIYQNDTTVLIVGYNLGKIDSLQNVNQFIKRNNYTFKWGYDMGSNHAQRLGFLGAPHEFIIHKNGKVVHSSAGFSKDISLGYIENITKLIKELKNQ